MESKIVIVLRDDLLPWQCANVTAGLMGGVVGELKDEEPYIDADGRVYLPLLRQPAFVFEATSDELKRTYDRAVSRSVRFSIFPEDIFATRYDADHRTAISLLHTDSMRLVGLAFHTDAKIADKITHGLKRHR